VAARQFQAQANYAIYYIGCRINPAIASLLAVARNDGIIEEIKKIGHCFP